MCRINVTIIFLLIFSHLSFAGQDKKPKTGKTPFNSFSENKQWEIRLKEKLRSGQEVRMVSPISGINYSGEKIEFSWENCPSGKIFLGILSNENKEILYKEVSGTKSTLLTKKINLKPGLYYWVLETEEDVLTTGKFFFKKN
jgi:hypothetical protein